ncbi:MAG: S8 family serine peptidase, partial [candidate division WOR-3 bacterium]
MFTALFIIILSNADFDFNYLYRKPDSPKIDPGCYQISGDQILVWVYFTDKGVFTASDYQRALSGNQQYIAPASKMRRKKRGGVYDFGDLPLCTDYIDEIHAAGGVLRWESKWLNGASFLLPKNVLERIANFDFVYKIKPVAHYEIFNELESPAVRQVSDTTAFSYHQHRMFNIDRLHKRGIFGSKVKVGFLDSGFSDKHEVFRYIKLAGQYDFISGDRVCFDTLPFSIRTNPPMSKGLIGEIFVHDGRTEDFVIYSKDSAVAGSGFRGLYGLRSLDGGRTWTEGQLSDLYSNAGYPWLCGQDTVYLFYHRYKTPSEIWGMARYNSLWDTIGNFYNGLYPSAGVIGDTFFLSYVSAYDIFSDTVLLMRKGTVGGFLSENIIYHSNQKIRKPWVITRSSLPTDSLVGILFYTYPTKNIIFLRSIDRGQNFTSQTVLSTATDFALATSFDTIYLICKKYSDLPSPYIVFLKSTDFGLTWQGEQNLTSNPLPAVGKLGVAVKDNQVFVEWERWGKVYYRRSNNSGSSFGNLDSLRGDFFYLPTPEYLTFQNDTNLFNFWVWRGDNNTDYEPNDPNRSQPDHGTHMVSIVGGFKTGTYVGVAPSAEFYMAKTENSDPAYEFPIEEDTYIAGLEWL